MDEIHIFLISKTKKSTLSLLKHLRMRGEIFPLEFLSQYLKNGLKYIRQLHTMGIRSTIKYCNTRPHTLRGREAGLKACIKFWESLPTILDHTWKRPRKKEKFKIFSRSKVYTPTILTEIQTSKLQYTPPSNESKIIIISIVHSRHSLPHVRRDVFIFIVHILLTSSTS